VGKATAGNGNEPEQVVLRAFLRTNSPVSTGVTATVEFGLEQPGAVSLVVFDVSGRRIRTLAQETLAAGTYARGWDGRDDQGNGVAAGIYLVKLETGEKVLTEKVARIR
ncbi:MAG TPA: FlgD immunoglobulin-like domain containing protein, partial [Thermoplasmata archaeon]|nr:FlgD immunoglobulin-like domain containing protein [Thermoplasmata archaeon]